MAINMNDFSFQVSAVIGNSNELLKQVEALTTSLSPEVIATLGIDITEAKKSLENIMTLADTLKGSVGGIEIKIDGSAAEQQVESLRDKIKDDLKVTLIDKDRKTYWDEQTGSFSAKEIDIVGLQAKLDKLRASFDFDIVNKLNIPFMQFNEETGKMEEAVDEAGNKITWFTKMLENEESSIYKVAQAIQIYEDIIKKAKKGEPINIDIFKQAENQANLLTVAMKEAYQAANLQMSGNSKNDNPIKSEQIELYKQRNQLIREEAKLTKELMSVNAMANAEQKAAIEKQITDKRKAIESVTEQIYSGGFYGKFFEQDIDNLESKGISDLTDKLTKGFDEANNGIIKQIDLLDQSEIKIRNYMATLGESDSLQKESLLSILDSITGQKEELRKAISSDITGDILSTDKDIAKEAINSNIEVLNYKNLALESAKRENKEIETQVKGIKESVAITQQKTAFQDKQVKLLQQITAQQANLDGLNLNLLSEEARNDVEQYKSTLEGLYQTVAGMDAKDATFLNIGDLTQDLNRAETSIKQTIRDIETLGRNNKNIKIELDIEFRKDKLSNDIKTLESEINKRIKAIEGLKITNQFTDTGELDNLINSYEELRKRKEEIANMPNDNAEDFQMQVALIKEISNEMVILKNRASDIGVDTAITKSFETMRVQANNITIKTREMEESIKKASLQYKNIDTKRLQEVETILNKIQAESVKLSSTKLSDFDAHNTAVKIQQLQTELKELGLEFTEVKNEAQSWDRAMSQFFDIRKVMAFTAQFTFLRQAISMITREVQALDSAMTTLRITIDGTESQYKDMTSSVAQMAKESGTTFEKALSLLKTYANSTDSIESTMAKIKPTMMLSNITDFSGAEAVDAVQAILEQFKLYNAEADNMEEASYRVTDALISISKSLKMDFASGTKEIADGIKASGAVAEQAGIQMEWYASAIASTIESTRMAGSQSLGFLFIEI